MIIFSLKSLLDKTNKTESMNEIDLWFDNWVTMVGGYHPFMLIMVVTVII